MSEAAVTPVELLAKLWFMLVLTDRFEVLPASEDGPVGMGPGAVSPGAVGVSEMWSVVKDELGGSPVVDEEFAEPGAGGIPETPGITASGSAKWSVDSDAYGFDMFYVVCSACEDEKAGC